MEEVQVVDGIEEVKVALMFHMTERWKCSHHLLYRAFPCSCYKSMYSCCYLASFYILDSLNEKIFHLNSLHCDILEVYHLVLALNYKYRHYSG